MVLRPRTHQTARVDSAFGRELSAETQGASPTSLARRAAHRYGTRPVLRAKSALLAVDLATLGHLFNASHASMRDDDEVSAAAIDRLVELATSQQAYSARLTGGGFGGAW
jgi:galactokinase